MVEYMNVPGVASGVVILVLTLYGLFRARSYMEKFKTPALKRFSQAFTIGVFFYFIGSIGVIVDSISPRQLWMFMAAFFTIGTVLMLMATFRFLSRFKEAESSVVKTAPVELPPSRAPTKKGPLPSGGFTITEEHLGTIYPLFRASNGVMVISRTRELKKYPSSPDRHLWLSRLEVSGAVDPAKLHVIMEETLRFVRDRGGNVVVILDGLEYLLLHNDFRSVMKFLASLKDHLALSGSTLLILLEKGTLDEREYHIIVREFPPFDVKRALSKTENMALFGVLTNEGTVEENERGEGEEEGSGKGEEGA